MSLQEIHRKLIALNKTLILAESCSGGHLAAKFTAMADASKYFLGSIVAYSNLLKEKLLHVSTTTLIEQGAVSRLAAHEMWIGAMKVSDADYGIVTTGIAGPTGGTEEKPVGTVFIGIGEKGHKPHIIECHFTGERKNIIQATCNRAIDELKLVLYPR